jgi:6-phospho-beta-glucosidase
MKITVVGGGSTYTPELVDGLARRGNRLSVEELALVDPNEERLRLVSGISARILANQGRTTKVVATTELTTGVEDADVVLIQLRIGGQAARKTDETFPHECWCIGQETTGAGGLAKALRTVPAVLRIADQVRQLAGENTWIVDFTNPVGIVTRALLDAGHRAVGLCNVAIGNQRAIASELDVSPHRVVLDHVGLNHLTWTRRVFVDGVDVLPDLLERESPALAQRSGLPLWLLKSLGAWPSSYLRYFYAHDPMVEEQQSSPRRADVVAKIERDLLDIYADPSVHTKPALLEKRGGAYYSEAAADLIESLVSDGGDTQVVNVRNQTTFPFLDPNAVIEVPALVGADAVTPAPCAPLDPLYAGLVAHVSAYEALALDAARNGGRERIFNALLAHPLVGQYDLASRLTDSLLAANHEYLAGV